MKHVIVIETADNAEFSGYVEHRIKQRISDVLLANNISCVTYSKFFVESAIAAVHEMYNAPKWDPNNPDNGQK